MPHYKKAFDIGTYTGNGGQLRIGIPTLRGVGPSGRQIAGSTRFRLGVPNYLTRTPGSTTSQTTSTWSFWIKKSALATEQEFLTAATSNHSSNPTISYIGFNGSDQLVYYSINNNVMTWYKSTNLAFRDTSVWTHFIVVTDTTNATASNRIRFYVNGSEVTSLSNDSQPSQNATGFFNSSSATHVIGREAVRNRYPLDGYMSEVYFIDGQALTPSSFGELNSDGIWVAKAYSGTYGTNGFYLPMNSSSNFATDQSGNGNNWTPTGFNTTTANTTYDLMVDSPTDYLSGSMSTANNAGNYATWSGIGSGSNVVLSEGNLYATSTYNGGNTIAKPTFPIITGGKSYWEFTIGSVADGYRMEFGMIVDPIDPTQLISALPTSTTLFINHNVGNTTVYASYKGSTTWGTVSDTISVNDVYMFAYDDTNGKFWFGKNGTWFNSGAPASGTGNIATLDTGVKYFPAVTLNVTGGTNGVRANFGQRPFVYTPPTGFGSINTYNYSRPADSSLWFYGDTPDLIWIKTRTTNGRSHSISDSVRGPGLDLNSDSSAVEQGASVVSEFNKFGMSVLFAGGNYRTNASAENYVYWAWKAGSNTSSTSVTNTDGSITSQVSANRQAGFSIVSYTLNNSTFTVGHGLGAAPNFIIVKNRDTTNNWDVYHSSVGAGYRLQLNATDAISSSTQVWNNTSPTSSVFSGNSAWWSSPSTSKMIAYCWTAIPGYSAFGSYTGNGSADGPFVYLGFRPKWIMIKVTSAIDHWILYDTVRSDYNPADDRLFANLTNAESASDNIDILSNGFKLRSSTTINNTSSGTYIYAAFAETPFKFARAR